MMNRVIAVLVFVAASVSGPGLAVAEAAGGSTGYVGAPSSAFVRTPGGLVSDLIYLNPCTGCPGPQCGCVFIKSSISDATSNQTIIGGVEQGQSMTVTAFSHPPAVWDEVME
jgi:hypothetical protein